MVGQSARCVGVARHHSTLSGSTCICRHGGDFGLTIAGRAEKEELIAVIRAQAAENEVLKARIAELERRLGLNSSNTSKPATVWEGGVARVPLSRSTIDHHPRRARAVKTTRVPRAGDGQWIVSGEWCSPQLLACSLEPKGIYNIIVSESSLPQDAKGPCAISGRGHFAT